MTSTVFASGGKALLGAWTLGVASGFALGAEAGPAQAYGGNHGVRLAQCEARERLCAPGAAVLFGVPTLAPRFAAASFAEGGEGKAVAATTGATLRDQDAPTRLRLRDGWVHGQDYSGTGCGAAARQLG